MPTALFKEKKEMGMREMKHHSPLYVNFLFLPALGTYFFRLRITPGKIFLFASRIPPNSYSAELSIHPLAAIPLAPTVTAHPSGWMFIHSERELKEFSEEIHPLNTEWNERPVFFFFFFLLWSLVAWRFMAPFQFPEFFNRLTEYAKNKKPPYFPLWSNNLFPSSTII